MRRALFHVLLAALTATIGLVAASPAAAAQTIGYPTFSGPAIPQPRSATRPAT